MLKKYTVLLQQQLRLQVISYNNIDNIRKTGSKPPPSKLLVSDPSLLLSCCRLQKLLNELYYPAHLPYVPFKLLNIKDCWKQSYLSLLLQAGGNNKGSPYFPSNTSLLQRRYQMVRWHLSHFAPLLPEQPAK